MRRPRHRTAILWRTVPDMGSPRQTSARCASVCAGVRPCVPACVRSVSTNAARDRRARGRVRWPESEVMR
jgi:hypothetical protein